MTSELLEQFRASREQAHRDYMQKNGYNWEEPITLNIGKKYAKLVRDHSVEAFIDLENGDIYKPASWAKPAKHVRGNIFDELGARAFDPQGNVKYLR
jgi:hypothetical protein